MADELTGEVKTFIVQALACFDDPSVVAKDVKEAFGVTVSRQTVHYYDATRKSGDEIDPQWRDLFNTTRAAFLEKTTDIAIANRAVRLRKLDRVARKAERDGNPVIVMDACEAAAKEVGDAFTNRRELTGKDGKDLSAGPPQVTIIQLPDNGRG